MLNPLLIIFAYYKGHKRVGSKAMALHLLHHPYQLPLHHHPCHSIITFTTPSSPLPLLRHPYPSIIIFTPPSSPSTLLHHPYPSIITLTPPSSPSTLLHHPLPISPLSHLRHHQQGEGVFRRKNNFRIQKEKWADPTEPGSVILLMISL